jgi:hypothetical protein
VPKGTTHKTSSSVSEVLGLVFVGRGFSRDIEWQEKVAL